MNNPAPNSNNSNASESKRAVRIGSQRDVADKTLSPERPKAVREAAEPQPAIRTSTPMAPTPPAPPLQLTQAPAPSAEPTIPMEAAQPVVSPTAHVDSQLPDESDEMAEPTMSLDDEIAAALGDMSIEQLMNMPEEQGAAELEADSKIKATVTRIHGDDVFLKLSGRFEAFTSLRQFPNPPEIGGTIEVIVKKFNDEEGMYDVSIPGSSISVADWSDLVPGAIVEARVTGTNTGGLECTVNNIRGFIPASQVAMYRIENFADFVDQKFQCVVTESNAQRERLVLSRRAILEREKAAMREELLKSIQPGQTLQGVVTKLMDFGAFVDIGGLEGLVHVSKLSWDRVTNPSEVLKVGEKIKVKVEKIEAGSGKLSLSYRDTLQDPWENIEQKYPANSVVSGTVSRIAQFGAFVKLEPGIEGLVHISELAHHRVFAVKNIVNEGDAVEVKVLSVDRAAQRMSLSLKATQARPEPKSAPGKDAEPVDAPPRPVSVASRNEPLKGGRDRKSGGEGLGLNW